jgi:hypothetical protein
MENQDYLGNEAKFQEIFKEFSYLSDGTIYSTFLKIATKEYANFLNEIQSNTTSNVVNLASTGFKPFVIKQGGIFVVNEKLVKKSITEAHKKGVYTLIDFFYINIVLDKVRIELSSRKKNKKS